MVKIRLSHLFFPNFTRYMVPFTIYISNCKLKKMIYLNMLPQHNLLLVLVALLLHLNPSPNIGYATTSLSTISLDEKGKQRRFPTPFNPSTDSCCDGLLQWMCGLGCWALGPLVLSVGRLLQQALVLDVLAAHSLDVLLLLLVQDP